MLSIYIENIGDGGLALSPDTKRGMKEGINAELTETWKDGIKRRLGRATIIEKNI